MQAIQIKLGQAAVIAVACLAVGLFAAGVVDKLPELSADLAGMPLPMAVVFGTMTAVICISMFAAIGVVAAMLCELVPLVVKHKAESAAAGGRRTSIPGELGKP